MPATTVEASSPYHSGYLVEPAADTGAVMRRSRLSARTLDGDFADSQPRGIEVQALIVEAALLPYFFPKNFFMFASPFTAMSSRFGSILRQIAAARAITFTSVVNDSMTMSPL